MIDLSAYQQHFFEALLNQDQSASLQVIDVVLAAGVSPDRVMIDVLNQAIDAMGRLQANQEITLSEIYVIARIAEMAINRIVEQMPLLPQAEHALVIGTVAGDYHGLGRKIVAIFLRVAGFQVYDLGMSVSSAVMVDEALKVGAGVICASGLLLHTIEKVSEVRTILQARGLEDRIKLVVGGAPFNFDPQLYRSLGADAYAVNAVDAVRVVRQMFAELK